MSPFTRPHLLTFKTEIILVLLHNSVDAFGCEKQKTQASLRGMYWLVYLWS